MLLLACVSKLRVEPYDQTCRYSHGPLGEAGVAGCGCMALWWWVETCNIGCISF